MTRKVNFSNCVKIHRACGYVTRGKELTELKRCLLGRGSALILGLPQVGKSAFLDDAAHEVEQIPGQGFKIVRLSGLGSDFCLDRQQDKRSVSEQFLEKLDETLRDKLVILLDEFNRLLDQLQELHPEELDGLGKVIYDCLQNGIRFVLVAQMSPYDQDRFRKFMTGMFPHRTSFFEIVIPPFAEDQLSRYCDYSRYPLPPEMRGEIMSYTHGHAGLVNLVLMQLNRQYEDKFCEIFQSKIVANHADLRELWDTDLQNVVFGDGETLVDDLKKKLPHGHAARRKLSAVHRQAVSAVDFVSACADVRCDAGARGLAQDELSLYYSVMKADNLTDILKKKNLLKAYGVLDAEGNLCGAVRAFQDEAVPAKTSEVVRERTELPVVPQAEVAEQGRPRLVVDLFTGCWKFEPVDSERPAKLEGGAIAFLAMLLGCRGITDGGAVLNRLKKLTEALARVNGGGNVLGNVQGKKYTIDDVRPARCKINKWSQTYANCCLMGKSSRGKRSDVVSGENRSVLPPQRSFDVTWLYDGKLLFSDEQAGLISEEAVPDPDLRKVIQEFLKK